MTAETLIRCEGLRRHFTMGSEIVHALDGVDASVRAGEFLALLGPSGSGKSTFLYLLGGLDRPTEGSIWVDGQEITGMDEDGLAEYRQHAVGFIFQSFHLLPMMTAIQNVELPMVFAGVPADRRRARAKELLELVGLGERMMHKPTELSGGQQQRVAIARALANDPRIILADEPTGNLDTRTGEGIMALLATLNRDEGKTVLIVSHDPSVVNHASRCMHLRDGRLEIPRDAVQRDGFSGSMDLSASFPDRGRDAQTAKVI
ncbi:MAG: ABC transporter ATP-binding protein [Anaerolineae bacterium]